MLQELAQWEEAAAIKEMLTSSSTQLIGCHVNVCNVQQPQNWISGVVTYHNMQTKVHVHVQLCVYVPCASVYMFTMTFCIYMHVCIKSVCMCTFVHVPSASEYISASVYTCMTGIPRTHKIL